MSDPLNDRLNKILPRLVSDDFLGGSGLGNEIAFYIFDYSPEEELRVREHVAHLLEHIPRQKPGLRYGGLLAPSRPATWFRARFRRGTRPDGQLSWPCGAGPAIQGSRMKLYNSLGPNPHTVRMFALEKGIDLPLQAIDVMGGEHRRPPYSVLNPMMQTPAFEADDGQVIAELTAICEYLEEFHPEPPLIGATPGERAETRMWVRRIDLNILEGRSRAGRATFGREFYIDKSKLLSVSAAQELAALV